MRLIFRLAVFAIGFWLTIICGGPGWGALIAGWVLVLLAESEPGR
jgi:hypothetical protein